jgi:hypothetical protein
LKPVSRDDDAAAWKNRVFDIRPFINSREGQEQEQEGE